MNYLAHAYLSFQQQHILLGNMISDYIKGKKQFDYPLAVQKGIRLHRAIDNFTDTHPATQELKSFFRPVYRLYSGAFADIVYDHFLANDTAEFTTTDILQQFAIITYKQLGEMISFFPPPFLKMYPHMKQQDWLSNYRHKWAIEKSFEGLVRRSAYLSDSKAAFDLFINNYSAMQLSYDAFFPDVKKFVVNQLNEI
jgi:acyl carrier protein phosphodiesterase